MTDTTPVRTMGTGQATDVNLTLTITIDLNAQPADITRVLHSLAGRVTQLMSYGPYGLDNIQLTDELGEIGRTSVE